jgi:hypothetical protein
MIVNEDDVKYRELIKTLNSLQQVKAPAGFETELMRRINTGNYVEKKNVWDSMLSPARLIPTSAVALAMIVFLLVFNLQIEDSENPLSIDPRVREDVVMAEEVIINREPVAVSPVIPPVEEPVIEELPGTTPAAINQGRFTASASNPDLVINKSGLNFRQINLNAEERDQLNKLRERVRSFLQE